MNQYSVTPFTNEIDQLTAEVARMGGLAEVQIADAVSSVARRDVAMAQAVIERDARLDALQRDVELKAIQLIAKLQPNNGELRRIVAALKFSLEIERIGDLAKNVAKRGLVLADSEPITPLTRSIERMGRLVAGRMKEVLDGYTKADLDRAMNVWARDDEVDDHYDSLFRELLTYMMGDPRTIQACAHLLFMAKNLERIGDHATNLAGIIHYQVTGQDVATERPRGLGDGRS